MSCVCHSVFFDTGGAKVKFKISQSGFDTSLVEKFLDV